jgi:hypothetical protein
MDAYQSPFISDNNKDNSDREIIICYRCSERFCDRDVFEAHAWECMPIGGTAQARTKSPVPDTTECDTTSLISYRTAKSSIASYVTARSVPNSRRATSVRRQFQEGEVLDTLPEDISVVEKESSVEPLGDLIKIVAGYMTRQSDTEAFKLATRSIARYSEHNCAFTLINTAPALLSSRSQSQAQCSAANG